MAAVALTTPALALQKRIPQKLSFYHTHTGERLNIQYGESGHYDKSALAEIDWFLRDFRTQEVHPIDPNLLDQLASSCHIFDNVGTFEVISGFRSPKTNQQLRSKSANVAKRSLHMKGQAIDVRLTGVQNRKLQQCALKMQCGGVGYYPNFVHLDTGRVRRW